MDKHFINNGSGREELVHEIKDRCLKSLAEVRKAKPKDRCGVELEITLSPHTPNSKKFTKSLWSEQEIETAMGDMSNILEASRGLTVKFDVHMVYRPIS